VHDGVIRDSYGRRKTQPRDANGHFLPGFVVGERRMPKRTPEEWGEVMERTACDMVRCMDAFSTVDEARAAMLEMLTAPDSLYPWLLKKYMTQARAHL
jgi:hypothetical protein